MAKMSKQEESYFSFLNIIKINNYFANLQFVRQDEYPLERHFLLHSLVGCIWISSTYAEAAWSLLNYSYSYKLSRHGEWHGLKHPSPAQVKEWLMGNVFPITWLFKQVNISITKIKYEYSLSLGLQIYTSHVLWIIYFLLKLPFWNNVAIFHSCVLTKMLTF